MGYLKTRSGTALIFVLFVAFVAVLSAKVRYTGSDPRATLLLSESIIRHGTLKLDNYGSDALESYGYVIHKKNGHYYSYFPIGTSLASIPFVVIANGLGREMLSSEGRVQVVISAVVSIAILLFLFGLARLFLDSNNALLISSVFWFGTSFSSTIGTALWSHDFAVLFALMAVYFSVKSVQMGQSVPWYLIAVLLFSAYLCRPTLAILAPFVLVFLFSYSRVGAIKSGMLLATLFVAFILFSLHEFGQALPDYYLPQRLNGERFYEALYGNVFSPARGLLIYSPFLAFSWLCIKYSEKTWKISKAWLAIGIGWPVAHLIFISRFPHWWGGHSYGSRLMVDALPGLFLLTLYTWPRNIRAVIGKMPVWLLILSCLFSMAANTIQGLFNKYTVEWNGSPNVDEHPEYLFDWNYPQFLANKEGHRSRLMNYVSNNLAAVRPGEVVEHDSGAVIYLDWARSGDVHRLKSGESAYIIFNVDEPRCFSGNLRLNTEAGESHGFVAYLNGSEIYSSATDFTGGVLEVAFNKDLIRFGANTLAFHISNKNIPINGGKQVENLALASFQIR